MGDVFSATSLGSVESVGSDIPGCEYDSPTRISRSSPETSSNDRKKKKERRKKHRKKKKERRRSSNTVRRAEGVKQRYYLSMLFDMEGNMLLVHGSTNESNINAPKFHL
jgi:hypothetical protein